MNLPGKNFDASMEELEQINKKLEAIRKRSKRDVQEVINKATKNIQEVIETAKAKDRRPEVVGKPATPNDGNSREQ